MRNKMRNLQATPTINRNNVFHYSSTDSSTARKVLKSKNKSHFKIELVSTASHIRKDVEAFVKASYKKHFSANLNTFFPLILTVINTNDDSIVGALGLRYAGEEKLFSECYLPESIEDFIFAHEDGTINRNKIIELGNFVVKNRTDIKAVLPLVAQFIKSLDVDWAIYTLTRPIKSYFNKFGIELNFLHDAKIKDVNGAATDWGRYYNFNPAVYYSSVKNNMNEI